MSKILFSPIGNTDPISQKMSKGAMLNYDGSMLHICRYKKPDIVYLYLSADMVEFNKKDHRYEESIKRLGEEIGHSFTVHVLEREKVEDPQKYDSIFQSFEDEISEIRKDMIDGDELIFNLSSGTPAMKNALLVIAATADYEVSTVQVDSPLNVVHEKKQEIQEYNVEELWKNNKDNFEKSVNGRTRAVTVENINARIKKGIIAEHIRKYNYSAALDVAQELGKRISQTACDFLELAAARVQLQTGKVLQKQKDINKELKKLGKEEIEVIHNKETDKDILKSKVYEYALALDIKKRRGEYGDYVRALSPLIVNLFILILEKRGMNIIETCFEDTKDTKDSSNFAYIWDCQKVSKQSDEYISEELKGEINGDRYHNVKSSQLLSIIQKKCKNDDSLCKNAQAIRDVEINLRNTAAHAIVAITKDKVNDLCDEINGIDKKDAINAIKNCIAALLIEAGIIDAENEKKYWDSYDEMNTEIIAVLENKIEDLP